MKSLVAAIRTSPLAASLLGVGSLALLVIKLMWLDYLPPAFAHAHELGVLAEGFLIANVSAYIFFIRPLQLSLQVR